MAGRATSDARILDGMAAQRTLMEDLERDGARVIGFKAGFGASGAIALLRIDAPLIGFLPDSTLLTVGDAPSPVAVGGWARPHAEAEVAVRLGSDLSADASESEALAAISSIAPAIELADLHLTPAPEEVRDILAGDIFHRSLLLGDAVPTPGGWKAAQPHVTITHRAADGTETVTVVDDVEAVPGTAGAVLMECVRVAPLLGRGLRAGDVVILGSVIPPLPVRGGEEFRVTLADSDPIAVALTD
jgi:2-keto-4-pentenoate hydratase